MFSQSHNYLCKKKSNSQSQIFFLKYKTRPLTHTRTRMQSERLWNQITVGVKFLQKFCYQNGPDNLRFPTLEKWSLVTKGGKS